jgi:hypothetical protein
LKKQYLLKLKERQAKELKNADLLIKKNKELESLLPKSSNLFTPSKDGSGSNFSSNSAVSTTTTTTTTTTTPATNKKKRKRSNEKDDGNKKEVLNVKEIMIESIDVESNYNFNYFLIDKDPNVTWGVTFHDSDQLRARFVHDHKNGRTTWVALESFVASHDTYYDNSHRAILLPIAKAIFPNILIKQKPLPVSILILVAEDYRRLLNHHCDRIDHGTNCDKTSFMWNRISADSEFHDDVNACAYIGFAYFNGKGVKRSSRNAWPYLKKAAKLGHHFSQMICTSNGKAY